MTASVSGTRGDPERLAALRRVELLDAPAEEAFDRLTRLAVKVLGVPAAFISLVDEDRDFYLSHCGFGEPLSSTRQLTGETFCHYAILSKDPLVIQDTRAHPVHRHMPTVESLGVAAYVGVPLITGEGHALGSFCVIDQSPRTWTEVEVSVLRDLAASAVTEIEWRREATERQCAEADQRRTQETLASIVRVQQQVATAGVELDYVMDVIIQNAQALTGAAGVVVELAEGEEMVYRAVGGTAAPHLGLRLRIDRSMSGLCVRTGELLRSEDTEEDERVDREACRRVGARSIVVVPLRSGEGAAGVLKVYAPEPAAFGDAEVDALRMLGALLASSIGDAQRFEAMEVLLEERGHIERTLRESEERYRTLFEHAGEGFFLVERRPEGGFAYADMNESLVQILGIERDAFVGRSPEEALPPETSARVSALYAEVFESGDPREVFHTNDLPRGRVTTHTRYYPVKDAGGRVLRILAVARDITGQVQAEEDLRASEARTRQILESAHDAFITMDASGRVVDWNRQAERTFGWTREEAAGQTLAGLVIPPAQREAHQMGLDRFLATGEARILGQRLEVMARHRDGREFPVELSLTPLRTGDSYLFSAFLHDITERRRAEEALKASEERFRQLFESSVDGVFITERDGTITDVNEAVLRLTGYAREELRRLNAAETYADPSNRQRFRELLERDGAVQDFEVEVRRKDGSTFHAIYSATVRRNDAGEVLGYQGVVHDISERKRAEVALQESEARFRQLSAATNEAVFLTERGFVLDVNEAAARMFGYATVEEMAGRQALDFAAPESRDLMRERIRAGYSEPYELLGLRRDGARFPSEAQGGTVPYQGREVRVTTIRDLTERKRVEAALQASEERFRTLFDEGAAAVLIHDEGGRILQVNRRLCESLGYTKEELLRLPIWEIETGLLPENLQHVWAHRRMGVPTTVEGVHRRKDGHTFPVEVQVTKIALEGQEVILAEAHDVTERKRAEEAVERSEAKFRALTENAHDVVTIIGADGVIRYESPSVVHVLGYQPEELVGRDLFELIHPEDQPAVADLFQHALARPGEKVAYQLRYRHKDGRWIMLDGIGRNLIADPAVGGVVANSRDVTERAEAEAAVRESNALLQTLFDASPLAIQAIDGAGNVSLWNRAAERIFGWAEVEVLGRPNPLVPEEWVAEHQALREQVMRGESITGAEVMRQRKGGSYIPISLSKAPLRDAEGTIHGTMAVIEDISERKRSERLLASQRAELERSNRELQDFAYIASHDLQEPLRKVQAFGDRLRSRHAEALGDTGRDYLERMQGAANRMQVLIRDLLAYSRVTTKAQPFVPVDLAQVAGEVAGDLQSRIETAGARVEIGGLPEIEADSTQMRQLLQNLIGNALKFHREGVPPVVQVSGMLADDQVQLQVEDNGIGFEEQYLDRIFTPFERLHGRSGYEGTGMGLAICRKIAQHHGGDITARSTPGEGTTFVVTLPVRHSTAGGEDEPRA